VPAWLECRRSPDPTTPSPSNPPQLAWSRAGGRIPADTDKALTLREASYPAVQYAPLAEIDQDVIRHTETHTRELGVHRRKVKRIIDQAAQDAGRLVA
jgi:Domain of unknown function (DUF427)